MNESAPLDLVEHEMWPDGRDIQFFTCGSGTPVLFIHGWGSSPTSYETAIRELAKLGHRVIAPSLPGFGHSSPRHWHRNPLDVLADFLADFAHTVALPTPLDVVAHSMGGAVALRLAAIHPTLVGSASLFMPAGGADDGPVSLKHMVEGLRHSREPNTARSNGFLKSVARHPIAVLAAGQATRNAVACEDLAAAGHHGIPVRIVFADRDEIVAQGTLPATAATIPGVEVVTVEGNHSWPNRQPSEFAREAARRPAPVAA